MFLCKSVQSIRDGNRFANQEGLENVEIWLY